MPAREWDSADEVRHRARLHAARCKLARESVEFLLEFGSDRARRGVFYADHASRGDTRIEGGDTPRP